MDAVFKALADPTRRALLDRLYAKNGQPLGELCADLGMTRQAIAQHLALLEQANLIATVWQGREKLHYLNPLPLHEISERWIGKYEQRRLQAISDLKQRLERRRSQMDKPAFVYVSYIATTPERLWAALTQGEFTQQYWYGRRIESTWQAGAPVEFFDRETPTLTDHGVVLVCDPPRQLAYTFRNAGQDPADPDSRVTFTLEPHGDLVKLTLIHDQLPDEAAADGFREGWAPILSSLKTFLETGRPLPQLKAFEERGQPGD